MSDELIKISFLGIDERSMSAYDFFFNSIQHISCELVDDRSLSQICLIDKDAYNIREQYEKFTQSYPDQYIISLSLKEVSSLNDREFFLQKPVKRDALQIVLKQIYQLISGKTIKKIPAAKNIQTRAPVIDTFDESTQRVKINLDNNQLKINTVDHQAKDDRNTKVIPITTPVTKKQKAVTSNAGKLLKIVNEKDFVGEQRDIDINDPKQLDKIFYNPDRFFQAIVEKTCIKSKQADAIIQLNIFNRSFYFDHQEQTVYSTVGPGILRPLCLIPHDNNISYKLKDAAFRVELQEMIQSSKNQKLKKTLEKHCWNMESFMWLISLWSSRGRLPKGTSLTAPVYLVQWPNLTRLDAIPHAVRIAALLIEQAHTLPDAARLLGIEQRYVFAFYSACKSIGLANISQRQIDNTLMPEKPAQHKNQSILRKLLGKLTGFRNKSRMTSTG